MVDLKTTKWHFEINWPLVALFWTKYKLQKTKAPDESPYRADLLWHSINLSSIVCPFVIWQLFFISFVYKISKLPDFDKITHLLLSSGVFWKLLLLLVQNSSSTFCWHHLCRKKSRKKLEMIKFFIFICIFLGKARSESFSEELLLKPLANGDLLASFNFVTLSSMSKSRQHFDLMPR